MLKLTDELRFKVLQKASGNFLCEDLPDNWEDMEEEEQNNFLEENAWEPFENKNVDEIWSNIEAAGDAWIAFMIREKLVAK